VHKNLVNIGIKGYNKGVRIRLYLMNRRVYMKRRYDIIHAVILVSFLVIANFVGSVIIKDMLLFLFASVLTVNTALKLKSKMKDKIGEQIFYWVLLILDIILAIGAIVGIVMSVIGS
jgi:hypothetical protein